MARLRIRLRECVDLYERRTGERLTYADVARRAGVSPDTVKKISNTTRRYNATLEVIERLCDALGVTPAELLEWRPTSARRL